jgi:hypothetical protein
MVGNAAILIDGRGTGIERLWSVDFSGRKIVVRPDRVFEDDTGVVVAQRFRTGRKSASEAKKPIWSILLAAGNAMFPRSRIRLEAFYPASGSVVPMAPEQPSRALADYAEAVGGIERGAFEPRVSRDCPACRFYFICTSEDR